MRRLAVLLVAMVAVAGLANVAMAGDYHVGRLLICSDCHIAHGSQKHGYTPGTAASDADTTWLGAHAADPPYPYLLRGETVNNACLNCHNGKSNIPDVLGASPNPPTNGRSAGALNVVNAGAHGYTNTMPYTQGTGHTLWSTDPPPGATATAPAMSSDGLECSDCHRVHGSKYFRNMMGTTSTSTATFIDPAWRGKEVTYAISPTAPVPNTGASGVWVLEKSAHNYDTDNVQYLEPDQTKSVYGEWCGTCHGNFHGNLTATDKITDLAGHVIRHPTAGVEMVSGTVPAVFSSWKVSPATHRLKVMDNAGAWAAGTSLDMTPSCFTCHKSHGNANKFGLVFVVPNTTSSSAPAGSDPRLIDPTRSAAMTEEGDGGEYRDMCRNCHGMGSWPSAAAGTPPQPTNILP